MKTTVTNSYNIDWRQYINEDAIPTLDFMDQFDNIKNDINIYIININGASTDDPCLTCPNRGGPRDVFGNPTVGDSPCQWCRHYKWRITW